ncbi:acetyl-coenzyme A transporter 1-like [Sipha flava]|uniref:Acetyl-coenzyme A transporter 1 n=1 Tax=Sipha flava TaxID=143950 RepID=A0A2S2R8Q0_9HEMI|nr:acetyl-coenzyme A transporter 1-like [Sipha flava]
MISSKQVDKTKTSITENVALTDTNLDGDWPNFFLLILMYAMQGLCLGLISAIPILLKSRSGGTYYEQALYSFSGYPFSIKLLWAPLVDAFFIQKLGRRKSWLIPTQILIGIILLYAATVIDIFLPETGKPNIVALIVVFGALSFLSATQDVAVDGWALTMLKKNNVGYASTCNSTGQALGMLLGNYITVLFTSKEFCNTFLRSSPATEGIVSFQNLLFGWGITFILLTMSIAIFKKEKDSTLDDDYLEVNIVQNYLLLWNIFKLRNVQILAAALLTVKIGFAATDSVANFKLMDAGLSKDDITVIQSVVPGINLFVPLIVAKYTSGPKPISVYIKLIPYRLLLNLAFPVFVYFTPAMIYKDGVINIPIYYYVIFVILTFLHQIFMYIMFVAMLSFFNRISDPRFGGTYMTLLNTLSNFGIKWTATAAFGLINFLTIKKCPPEHRNINAANEDDCDVTIDGYYIETILCSVIGIIWISIFRKKLKRFQTLSPSHWLVHGNIPNAAIDKNACVMTVTP